MILDCESVEKTYESLERILGICQETLCGKLNNYIIKPEIIQTGKTQDELLYSQIIDPLATIPHTDSWATVFFHMSRVLDVHSLKNGIMPLSQVLTHLESDIKNFIKTLDIKKLPKKVRNTNSYNSICHRMSNHCLDGPYAILIKEMCTCKENRHFLDVPETINDILSVYEHKYQKNIIDEYRRSTRPCIVKFINDGIKEKSIKTALYYLYCKEHHLPLAERTDQGFDGCGQGVSKEQILNVEMI